MKIYIISQYEEDGANNVSATTDKHQVKNICMQKLGNLADHEADKIEKLLDNDEINVDGDDITHGWGGLMLHIVETG